MTEKSASKNLTLEQYALLKNISAESAWQQVQGGKLLARFDGEDVIVFLQKNTDFLGVRKPEKAGATASAPLPVQYAGLEKFGENHMSAELALLVDHLSLAKEENLEILKLTQTIIKEEKARNHTLTEELNSIQQEVSELKQQIEDLKMLNKVLRD